MIIVVVALLACVTQGDTSKDVFRKKARFDCSIGFTTSLSLNYELHIGNMLFTLWMNEQSTLQQLV